MATLDGDMPLKAETLPPDGDADADDFDPIAMMSRELSDVPIQKKPINPNLVDQEDGVKGPMNAIRLAKASTFVDEDRIVRTGNTFTASAHIITAVS